MGLSHLVYGLADAGNLSCNVVLMVNALAASHLDHLGSVSELSLCSFLVARLDSSENLLDRSLNARSDRLISLSIHARYGNSLLCGLNISQCSIPPFDN